MKLRNKKTGETGYYLHTHRDYKTGVLKVAVLKDGVPFSEFKPYEPIYDYDSLAELNEEWEDVSEEEVWYLGKRIGNYSMPKKEADIVTEKILAWKRLKDKGFKFDGYDVAHKSNGNLAGQIFYDAGNYSIEDVEKEMDLIFGGEE